MEIRVTQDGTRDGSTSLSGYRADESGGWIWEATHALEVALLRDHGDAWAARKPILELGSGTGFLALRMAQRGARVRATDREGALPRIVRNVLRNQSRFGLDAAGDQLLQVECCALDWEAACDEGCGQEEPLEAACDDEAADEAPLGPPWSCVVGSDLIYMHEMHVPLLRTLARHAGSSPCYLSWEQRKPVEEERFLELARSFGFECELVHQTTSSVNGAPITVHRLCQQQQQHAEPSRQPEADDACHQVLSNSELIHMLTLRSLDGRSLLAAGHVCSQWRAEVARPASWDGRTVCAWLLEHDAELIELSEPTRAMQMYRLANQLTRGQLSVAVARERAWTLFGAVLDGRK